MKCIREWISGELTGWKKSEVIWFAFCVLGTLGAALYLNDNAAGIIAALTGIFYTLLAGKGKISCYGFGIINSLLYGWLSFEEQLYGEVMLNWGWYFPMMFAGLFFWKKNMGEKQIIQKQQLSKSEKIICYLISAAAIAIYAAILKYIGDTQPLIDSATTILSVAAMILTVQRCADQWIIWTIVNVLSIWMWFKAFQMDGKSAAILFMWLVTLANGIIFYFQWKKDLKICRNN